MPPAPGLKLLSVYCSAHITPFEVELMQRFIRLRRIRMLTLAFTVASRLGDGWLWAGIGLALLVFGGREGQLALAGGGMGVAVSVALFTILKTRIGRPRPFEVWPQVSCLLVPPDRFSFPSGHTMTSFAIYGAFSILLPACSLLVLPAAILIGLSRVYLGVHYPSDVLAGSLLGTGIGCSAGWFTQWAFGV